MMKKILCILSCALGLLISSNSCQDHLVVLFDTPFFAINDDTGTLSELDVNKDANGLVSELKVRFVVSNHYFQEAVTLEYETIAGNSEWVRLGGREINARSWVSRFNFSGADQEKLCGVLSGGERNRLHLALTLKDEGNVLLLDEPTNDVDVNTIRALEDGLDSFAGCAVVVSHDRWFLDRIATHILAFEGDSQVYFFEGSYSEYEENRLARLGDQAQKRFKYKKLMEG